MIMLAQQVPINVTTAWAWGLFGFIGVLGAALFFWNQLMKALGKQNQQTIAPQPLAVEITKQLDERFADKKEFEDQKDHCTERHGQLFNRIDKAERDARRLLDQRFEALAEERKESLEKLNNQFAFIREAVVELRTEIKHLQRHRS